MKNLNIFSSVANYENAKSTGILNVPNVSFINELGNIICLPKPDFTHNGYEYVDLGLPSGLKWATCNVGAVSPEEYGLYFAWGETTGYTGEQVTSRVREFNQASYTASSISADLTLEQDAAHVNLGGNWRMPTKNEYQELIDNCNIVWIDNYNGKGVNGKVFTSKFNGNSVFFPAASFCIDDWISSIGFNGDYWVTSFNDSVSGWYFSFDSGGQGISVVTRKFGLSVRGVYK